MTRPALGEPGDGSPRGSSVAVLSLEVLGRLPRLLTRMRKAALDQDPQGLTCSSSSLVPGLANSGCLSFSKGQSEHCFQIESLGTWRAHLSFLFNNPEHCWWVESMLNVSCQPDLKVC